MKNVIFINFLVSALILIGCSNNNDSNIPIEEIMEESSSDFLLSDIDLSHWKVTLPIGNPTEVTPPEILNYANNPLLQKYMYNDSIDGSLVFYTYPGTSTPNAKYSRTELREQMDPGSNHTNWTYAQGGIMRGTLAMDEISKDDNGDYHKTIIMQIHGRLTDAQRDQIGEDDNNAPPVVKVYWDNGRVRVHRKVLKDINVSDEEKLKTSAWEDEKHWFEQEVGFDKFELEIRASDGLLEVTLNDQERLSFDDVHVQKWGVFENYFKAGNYLQSRDSDSFARVKFYQLVVEH